MIGNHNRWLPWRVLLPANSSLPLDNSTQIPLKCCSHSISVCCTQCLRNSSRHNGDLRRLKKRTSSSTRSGHEASSAVNYAESACICSLFERVKSLWGCCRALIADGRLGVFPNCRLAKFKGISLDACTNDSKEPEEKRRTRGNRLHAPHSLPCSWDNGWLR